MTVTQYIGLKFLVGALAVAFIALGLCSWAVTPAGSQVGALAVAFIALGFGFGRIGEWWERRRAKAYEAEVREWEARL